MESFITEWFANPSWWFSKTPAFDEYITTTYQHLLDTNWDDTNSSFLDRIILWDQLPRHVRSDKNNAAIQTFLEKALKEVALNEDKCHSLNNQEWMFFWLPVRHQGHPARIFEVMKKTWERMDSKEDVWLRKFLQATYQRCPTDNQEEFLETKPLGLPFDEVVEKGEPPQMGKPDVSKGVWEAHKAVIVSLSGGVDSMVILNLALEHYKHVEAVHINYANRETAFKEAAFVQDYCKRLGVKLHTRTIHEIKRKQAMEHGFRGLYETYTKEVRFGTYNTVWKMMGYDGMPVVLLGHNRDDCFENVMTNTTFQTKYDNLFGMAHWFSSTNEKEYAYLGRPLLSVSKKNIYAYAKVNDIPYLYDSTVSWCQRGKIRDKVVPTLLEWHEKSVDGLLELAGVTQELYAIMKQSVEVFIQQYKATGELVMDNLPVSALFWKEFFICGFKVYASNKAIQYFLVRIQKIEAFHEVTTVQKVMLHKGLAVHIHKRKSDLKFVVQIKG
jgi:tRNA(Ile)-lysidine synthetase-like protein